MKAIHAALITACGLLVNAAGAQENRIDVVTSLAPELAHYGPLAIGVRTLQVTDPHRVDILNTRPGGPTQWYDRSLTIEVWYPAAPPDGAKPGGDYQTFTRDPALKVNLHGQAVRDAPPLTKGGPYPLVLVSHGYPGNRYLMSHLCENLASKGYVVVAIDHKDSTYDDQQSFASTLYNRPPDLLFVLDEMERQSSAASTSFLRQMVDTTRTGLVGYSMGGYGLLNALGAGYSEAAVVSRNAPPNRLLASRSAANPQFNGKQDPRIKAAIAIAPWGMQVGVWDAAGLSGIRTPILLVCGSVDDVAGYELGSRAIFNLAVNADRYLLTFVNASHHAAAPIPAPLETYAYSATLKYSPSEHYSDPVWDTTRMNNILDHFASAFFSEHLQGMADQARFLDGKWQGFKRGTAVGLVLEHLEPRAR